MKIYKLSILTVSMALGLGFSNYASASISAQSYIDMTNFVIKDANGIQIENGNQISLTNVFNTTDISAELNGVIDQDDLTGAVNQNLGPVCVGSGCLGVGGIEDQLSPDVYPKLASPPTLDYVAADQRDVGSPITGNIDGTNFPVAGADVSVGSWAGLATGTGEGTAVANNGLSASFTFTANQDIALLFEFDIRSYIDAFVSGDELAPTAAQAEMTFGFSLFDEDAGTFPLDLRPAILNPVQLSLLAPKGADTHWAGQGYVVNTEFVGGFSVFTGVLVSGHDYTLSASMITRTDITRGAVPEPMTLGLLGLGLLGLGAARRGRQPKQS